jgi:putative transposase
MKYSPRFRLDPTDQQRELLEENVEPLRQLYNDRLKRFKEIPDDAGTLTQRVRIARDELPALMSRISRSPVLGCSVGDPP